jgi:hypothetical protein
MRVTHFEFIGGEVDGEEPTFNLNIYVSWWVGGKSFKRKKKLRLGGKKRLGRGLGENKVVKKIEVRAKKG